MKIRLQKLLEVKSIVTFLLIGAMCFLAVRQNTEIPSEAFVAVISSVITYFFTRTKNEGA